MLSEAAHSSAGAGVEFVGEGRKFEVKILEADNKSCTLEYKPLPPQSKKPPEEQVCKAYIPDADTRGAKVILDLKTGEMLPLISTGDEALRHLIKLGKGDLAFEDELWALRGASISLWKDGKWHLVLLQREDKELKLGGYTLPELPCRLLVTTAEGLKFEVTVLSEEKNEGIHIEYKALGGGLPR